MYLVAMLFPPAAVWAVSRGRLAWILEGWLVAVFSLPTLLLGVLSAFGFHPTLEAWYLAGGAWSMAVVGAVGAVATDEARRCTDRIAASTDRLTQILEQRIRRAS
jgi:hypothetical protein